MYYSLVFIFKIETVINILITKPGEKFIFEIDYLFLEELCHLLKLNMHTHTCTPQPEDECLHFHPTPPSHLFHLLMWCLITLHLIKGISELPFTDCSVWRRGCILLDDFLFEWHLFTWECSHPTRLQIVSTFQNLTRKIKWCQVLSATLRQKYQLLL